jgi:hypothetical protein
MSAFILALAVVLAGCSAATTLPTEADSGGARLAQMRRQSREIAARDQRCVAAAMRRAAGRIEAAAATPNAFAEMNLAAAANERGRDVARCRAESERENGALAASQRNQYDLAAHREHDRAALMMILTSRPH